MERTDYILSEKFIPASTFFALNGSSAGTGSPSGQGGGDKKADWSDKIDADAITAGLETAQGLIGLFKKGELSEVENACGKQPKFLARRARKQQWAQCASDYMKAKLEASKPKEKKGLSTGVWIGIGVGSAALIGMIIAVVATRKKGTVVMAQPAPIASPARMIKR